jgi:hypothetical protein
MVLVSLLPYFLFFFLFLKIITLGDSTKELSAISSKLLVEGSTQIHRVNRGHFSGVVVHAGHPTSRVGDVEYGG